MKCLTVIYFILGLALQSNSRAIDGYHTCENGGGGHVVRMDFIPRWDPMEVRCITAPCEGRTSAIGSGYRVEIIFTAGHTSTWNRQQTIFTFANGTEIVLSSQRYHEHYYPGYEYGVTALIGFGGEFNGEEGNVSISIEDDDTGIRHACGVFGVILRDPQVVEGGVSCQSVSEFISIDLLPRNENEAQCVTAPCNIRIDDENASYDLGIRFVAGEPTNFQHFEVWFMRANGGAAPIYSRDVDTEILQGLPYRRGDRIQIPARFVGESGDLTIFIRNRLNGNRVICGYIPIIVIGSS